MMSDYEIYTAYAPYNDITFIMKDTLDENGEPDDQNTRDFIGDLVAEYK